MTQLVSAVLAFSLAAGLTTEDQGTGTSQEGEPNSSAHGLPRRPLRFERCWPVRPTAGRLAQIHARTWLTTWRWAGDHDEAQLAVALLMDNAVRHPTTSAQSEVGLALEITEEEELIIDVSDADPNFEGFAEVVAAARARAEIGGPLTGIALLLGLGGEITWGIPDIGAAKKIVRVRMRPCAPAPCTHLVR